MSRSSLLLLLGLLLALASSERTLFAQTQPQNQPTPPSIRDRVLSGGSYAADQLQRAVSSLDRAKKPDAVEPLVERTMRLYANDWRVLFQGARIYAERERAGYWVKGRYLRGNLRGNIPKGAKRVYSHKRDHLRALQLLDRAIKAIPQGAAWPELADFYWEAAQILIGDKAFTGLYSLTDLNSNPTLDYHEPLIPNREPVPLDEEGNPVFFVTPPSWDAARNDGERLLWLLTRARQLNSDYAAEAEFIHTKHLLKAYLGVQTITESPDYDPKSKTYDGSEVSKEILSSIHTLTRDETVARVDGGVKRFELPDAHHFIKRLTKISTEPQYASHAALALEELAECFENRRQYDVAADHWQRSVSRAGESPAAWEQERLDQIVKSWGKFEDARAVQAGDSVTLRYWYRNGTKVRFTAHRVDVTAIVSDMLGYLRSDPFPVDPGKISVSKLGLHLVREGGERYRKEKVHEWEQPLELENNHWDQRVDVPVPIERPGAYIVEATIDGGNTSSVMVWINDMTILRRPLDDGLFYYVADKRNGSPIGWAKFSFIGFRLVRVEDSDTPPLDEHGEEIPLALRRQYHVETEEISKWADAKGQLILDSKLLKPDYRWFLLATAPGNRTAVLGFSDLKPTGQTAKPAPTGVRHFLVPDRLAYLPGQALRFRGWLRSKAADRANAYTVIESQPVTAHLLTMDGQALANQSFTTDAKGFFQAEMSLPPDLPPGNYYLLTQHLNTRGQVLIHVRAGALSRSILTLEPHEDVVTRGQETSVRVRTERADGQWLGLARVKYQVYRRDHQPRWKPQGDHAWLFGQDYDDTTQHYPWFTGWKYWGWGEWPSYEGTSSLLTEGELITGQDGQGVIRLQAEAPSAVVPVAEDYVIKAFIEDDETALPAETRVTVSERPHKVSTRLDRPFYRPGEKATVDVWLRDYEGDPVSMRGELVVYQIDYQPVGKPTERATYRKFFNLDAEGHLQAQVGFKTTGPHRITFILDPGPIEGSAVTTVVPEDYDGADARYNDLEILPDKLLYEPGDRAQLTLNTNRLGQSVALFVRPRNGVFGKAEVLRLEQKSTPYEILVEEEDAPSFHVEAILLNEGEFEVHTREIFVSPPTSTLDVSLSADREDYRPGDTMQLGIRLTDPNGAPQSGDVLIGITPAGIDGSWPDVRRAFWDERHVYEPSVQHQLKTRFQSFSKPPGALMRPIGIFGAMAMGKSQAVTVEENPLADSDDLPSQEDVLTFSHPRLSYDVVWLDPVAVNGSGTTAVLVNLPEHGGHWEINAWALNEATKAGQARLRIETKQPYSIDFRTPAWLAEGDQVTISTAVRNRLDTQSSTNLALTVSPPLQLSSGSSPNHELQLAPGHITEHHWDVQALANAPFIDKATFKLQLGEGTEAETREAAIPILRRESVTHKWWNAELTSDRPQKELTFSLPPGADLERSELRIHAATTPLALLLGMLDQPPPVASTLDAASLIHQVVPPAKWRHLIQSLPEEKQKALASAPSSWAMKEDFTAYISGAIQQLGAWQCEDGGWNWSGKESEELTTATVVEGLLDLKDAGVTIPVTLLKRGTERLRGFQKAANARLGSTKAKHAASSLDALTYLVLLRNGSDSTTMRQFLQRDWKKLPNHGKTLFALALHARGDTENRNTIRFHLGEQLRKDESSGAISLSTKSPTNKEAWVGHSIATQARYLDFLIPVKGDSAVTDALARYLFSRRQRPGQWPTARATTRALNALINYTGLKASKHQANAAEESLVLLLGDRQLGKSVLPKGTIAGLHQLRISGADLLAMSTPAPPPTEDHAESDTQEVPPPNKPAPRLVYKGGKPLRFHAILNAVERPRLLGETGSTLSLKRHYFDSATVVDASEETESHTEAKPLPPGAIVKPQQVLDVVLKINAVQPLKRIRLTDHLPAGFEIVSALPDGAHLSADGNTLHLTLPVLEKETEIRYQITPTLTGAFHALPTEAFAGETTHRATADEMLFIVKPPA